MSKLVSVDEILSSPQSWHAREACVFGVFTYELENVSLRSTEIQHCVVWVEMDHETTEILGFTPINGLNEEVVVEGVVEIGKSGHFGMFPGQITHVRRIVAARIWFEQHHERT